jgi:hypothetical protein
LHGPDYLHVVLGRRSGIVHEHRRQPAQAQTRPAASDELGPFGEVAAGNVVERLDMAEHEIGEPAQPDRPRERVLAVEQAMD